MSKESKTNENAPIFNTSAFVSDMKKVFLGPFFKALAEIVAVLTMGLLVLSWWAAIAVGIVGTVGFFVAACITASWGYIGLSIMTGFGTFLWIRLPVYITPFGRLVKYIKNVFA